jgi:adenosylcobinamide-phosphate synthase
LERLTLEDLFLKLAPMLWAIFTDFGNVKIIALVLLLALFFDAALGDPRWLYRYLPHPIAVLGKGIAWGEKIMNRDPEAEQFSRRRGLIFLLLCSLVAIAFAFALTLLLGFEPGGWILEAVLAASLLAGRSLYLHVRAVADAMDMSLDAGRAAVAHIVGRDPHQLDSAGVARAAAESLAENFSDGLVAPVFWYLLLGLPGLLLYKCVNTLDSMIGHKTTRHRHFGRASARFDDVLNWLPARLSGLLLAIAANFLSGASPWRALQTMWRDAPKHRSPSAGWPESALAGALGYALAGPRHYADGPVEDAWMGDGRAALNSGDLREALRLYIIACLLLSLLPILLLLVDLV